MAKRSESPLVFLIRAPWWISAVLAPFSFVVMRWFVPLFLENKPIRRSIGVAVSAFAPYLAGFFVLTGVVSFIFGLRRRALVDGQTSLESVRQLSWKEFEWMVAEAFRRQGYVVEESLGGGADGGVDVWLRKNGQTTVVQCKQWKVFSVGAPVIRELFGVMTAEHAQHAIVITSGKFTRDAESFVEGKPIQLIDGPALVELIKDVQPKSTQKIPMAPSPQSAKEPNCPKCGTGMILRTASKGSNAGNRFWGCSNYPRCKQTINLAPTE